MAIFLFYSFRRAGFTIGIIPQYHYVKDQDGVIKSSLAMSGVAEVSYTLFFSSNFFMRISLNNQEHSINGRFVSSRIKKELLFNIGY